MAKRSLHLMVEEEHGVCGIRGGRGAKFTQDPTEANCQKCMRRHSYLLKARSEPPPAAQRAYAQGVLACEERGLPLSCLRIKYLLSFGRSYYGSWYWVGTSWLRLEPDERLPSATWGEVIRTQRSACADKGGIWFVFDSLDEAKMAGLIKPIQRRREADSG